MPCGYHGRLLQVDLTTGTTEIRQPEENFYRQYAGCGTMGAYFLLKETEPGLDPFDPQALLLFLSSVTAGFEHPGLARLSILGKSAETGGIGEARSEGPFAIALKKSGFDGILLKGVCPVPSILLVQDGVPALVPMEDLWGTTASQAMERLEAQYPGCSCAVIGPAGENRVRYANVILEGCHEASRGGLGGVMGSKQLKAVVLVGGQLPPVADEAALCAYDQVFAQKLRDNELALWQHDRPGFAVWIHTHGIDAAVCTNNYQSADCKYLDNFKPECFAPYYRGEAPCPGCPMHCIKRYAVDPKDTAMAGIHQEITGAMGPNVGNSSVERLLEANRLCNEYGMDPNALGYAISFAQECAQRGLLESDLNLSFSENADLLPLVELIAHRQGLGDLLAEGAGRAAQKLGKGSEKFAMAVKNSAMVPFEPRTQTDLALGYATAPVGPRYDICEHDWDFDTHFGWKHSLNYCRTLGILERIPMNCQDPKKVKNFKALNLLWSGADALGICMFATAPTRCMSLAEMGQILHAVTGWETSDYEIMRLGTRRLHLYRMYNFREGIGPEQDRLPDRFFEEPIDAGIQKGGKLDREKFQTMIDTYYEMMGWDRNGVPTLATQYDFGIEEL